MRLTHLLFMRNMQFIDARHAFFERHQMQPNTTYHAQLRRLSGVRFVVIEVATGAHVGTGSMGYAFAKHVRDTRDTFSQGAFLVKRVQPTTERSENGEQKTIGA